MILLLLVVVILWTTSNFLASVRITFCCSLVSFPPSTPKPRGKLILLRLQTIFADNSYSKPFFVTYINTAFFILPLIPIILSRLYRLWRRGKLSHITSIWGLLGELDSHEATEETRPFLTLEDEDDTEMGDTGRPPQAAREAQSAVSSGKLGLKATAKLSLEFCMLWVRKRNLTLQIPISQILYSANFSNAQRSFL